MGPLERIRELIAICEFGLGSGFLRRFNATGQVRSLNDAMTWLGKAVVRCPEHSRYRPACLSLYGGALRERYTRAGDSEDQNLMIVSWQEALQLTPADSPDRPELLGNIGIGWIDRFARTGELSDLEAAILSEEEALKILPFDSPRRIDILNILGNAYRVRYGRSGDVTYLDKARSAHEDAVRQSPSGNPNLHLYLNNLGDDLRANYNRSGNLTDLNRAVDSYQKASELCSPDAPIRPMYLSNFGTAMRLRYLATGDQEDLQQSLKNLTLAVDQTPEGAPNLPTYLTNLGAGLATRFSVTRKLADLEQAIEVDERSVRLTPSEAPERPGRQSSLAMALSQRYVYGGIVADLDRAIQLHEEALKKIPRGSPDGLFCLNNLGVALFSRFNATGDVANLQQAIDTYNEAMKYLLPESPTSSACMANLGAALRVRYQRLNDFNDVQLCITAYNSALEYLPANSPEVGGFLNDLANGWNLRYQFTRDLEDLNSVVAISASSVHQTSHESLNYPVCCSTLGSALRERFLQTHDQKDLDTAIAIHAAGLTEAQAGSPHSSVLLNGLANDLSELFVLKGSVEDLQQARKFYEQACQEGLQMDVETALMAASNWGNRALERGEWAECVRAYEFGLEAIDRLFRAQLLRVSKESWLRQAGNLTANCAYALAQTGALRRAVEVLEHGHARLLSQSLERDRADLDSLRLLAPEAVMQYVAAAAKLKSLESADVNGRSGFSIPSPSGSESANALSVFGMPKGQVLAELIRQSRSEVEVAVEQIRQLPSHQGFLLPLGIDEIRHAAQEAPLIYFAVTVVGGLALIALSARTGPTDDAQIAQGIDLVPLPELTQKALNNQLMNERSLETAGYFDSYLRWKMDSHANIGWEAALEETTHWIWDVAMEPIIGALALHSASRAVLVPQGFLGLLPLHAAWTDAPGKPTGRSYAADKVAFSYAPNARALAACKTIAAKTSTECLMVVGNPQPVTLAAPLPNAEAEAKAAASAFASAAVLNAKDATRQAILDTIELSEVSGSSALAPASWITPPHVWHFSCHGQAHLAQPLDSGLLLANDEWLTSRDLFALQLKGVRMAILSACETGVTGIHLPDELIGLPTALVQTGVAGVVASLWSVNEISTLLLLVRFYAFWIGESMPADKALQQAQIWLRDTLNEEKADYFKMSLPEFGQGTAQSSNILPSDVADSLFQDMMLRPLGERDFSHPYHWAAFSLTGV